MQIPLIDLSAQYLSIREEINEAIQQVLVDGQYIMGPNVKELEREIANYTGTRFAVGVGNGTDALVLVLKALGIGPGDEVITTPFTFFASAEGISQVGAVPVFVDIDPKTYCMNIDLIREKISSRTKAIIPVHLFGHPVDMEPLMEIARQYGIKIIEDACQAIGALYHGQPVGSFGDAACFSFFPTKNLGGYGDGGMVVTNNEELYEKIKLLRVHGSYKKYHHSFVGYNSRMDELQAAILRVKFRYLEEWTEKRRAIAAKYRQLLENTSVVLPVELKDCRHVYHLFVLRCEKRDELMQYLAGKGIHTAVYYPVPLHLQEVYKDMGFKPGDFPEAEKASRQALAIPHYPELDEGRMEYIAKAINEFF